MPWEIGALHGEVLQIILCISIYMCVCVSCSLVVSTCVHSYEGDPLDIYLVPSTTTCFSLALFFFRRNLYYIILGDGSFPFSFVISWAYTCKYKPSDYWGIFPSWYYHSSIVLLKSKTSSLRRRRPGISCTDWKMRCPVLWRLCNSTSFGSDEDHGSFDG